MTNGEFSGSFEDQAAHGLELVHEANYYFDQVQAAHEAEAPLNHAMYRSAFRGCYDAAAALIGKGTPGGLELDSRFAFLSPAEKLQVELAKQALLQKYNLDPGQLRTLAVFDNKTGTEHAVVTIGGSTAANTNKETYSQEKAYQDASIFSGFNITIGNKTMDIRQMNKAIFLALAEEELSVKKHFDHITDFDPTWLFEHNQQLFGFIGSDHKPQIADCTGKRLAASVRPTIIIG